MAKRNHISDRKDKNGFVKLSQGTLSNRVVFSCSIGTLDPKKSFNNRQKNSF